MTFITDKENLEIQEIARLALQDAEFFDRVAEECDLSDEYLAYLRDKLQISYRANCGI